MAKKEYKPKKDLITTITGTVFTAATAAAPFYPSIRHALCGGTGYSRGVVRHVFKG